VETGRVGRQYKPQWTAIKAKRVAQERTKCPLKGELYTAHRVHGDAFPSSIKPSINHSKQAHLQSENI